MNSWDELDRSAMETTIGRRMSNGVPLTGTQEHDEPDLDATGLKAIADFAHLRLARGDLLNQWITPIGSATFAIPPGCQPGGFIGKD